MNRTSLSRMLMLSLLLCSGMQLQGAAAGAEYKAQASLQGEPRTATVIFVNETSKPVEITIEEELTLAEGEKFLEKSKIDLDPAGVEGGTALQTVSLMTQGEDTLHVRGTPIPGSVGEYEYLNLRAPATGNYKFTATTFLKESEMGYLSALLHGITRTVTGSGIIKQEKTIFSATEKLASGNVYTFTFKSDGNTSIEKRRM